jgi:signal transduction histidine kinase
MVEGAGIAGAPWRLLRISSFRLALQSAALSAVAALIVFALIYHASLVTLRAALDNTVTAETADILSDVRDDGKPIIESVNDAISESAGTFYDLISPAGAELAGNYPITPRIQAAWRNRRTLDHDDGIDLPRHITAIRGLATRFPNGDTLYVAENASALHALKHLIAGAFLAVFGAILTLGLFGGLWVARGTLRRVEAISDTTRDIIHGDLSRRIALMGTGDEFDRLAENLNVMLERIEALMENVRQVSNDIAHDLRSPLARLREHLELSRQTANDAKTRLAFDDGIEQVDAALSIFGAMLRIAEVEAGARRRDFSTVDLSTLLRDLDETFETVAESEGIYLASDIPDDLHVPGDRELLTQMFVNIIENAIHHSPAGCHVWISARHSGAGHCDIIISDDGPGIPEADRARVLKRFVKLDASRHSRGTGLGLPLAVAVAGLHDGGITLDANQPGLRVTVRLPMLV